MPWLIILLWFCCGYAAAANTEYGLSDWYNPAPSALADFNNDPQQLAALTGNNVLVFSHAPQDFDLETKNGLQHYQQQQFLTSAFIAPVSAATVKQTITGYTRYASFFPKTTRSDLVTQIGKHSLMRYHVYMNIPFPMPNISEDVTAQHTLEHDNVVSARLIKAPMNIGVARYEWFALDDTHTLITFTTWVDLKSAAFLIRTIMNAFPDIKLAVPYVGGGFLAEAFRNRLAPDAKPNLNTLSGFPAPQGVKLNDQQKLVVNKLLHYGELSFIHPPTWIMAANNQPMSLRFLTTVHRGNQSLAQTRALTTSFDRYKEVFPQIRKTQVDSTPNGFNLNMKLGIGLGIFSLPVDVSLAHEYGKDNLVSFKAFAGDIEHIYGRWRWEQATDGSTWTILHAAGQLGDNPPHLLKLGKYLPYNDFLPTLGAQVISLHKTGQWIDQQPQTTH